MRFILTKELGKLSRWLRLIGFDAIYYRSNDLGSLIIQALRENRFILTRRRETNYLQKRTIVINSDILYEQLKELKNKADLEIKTDKMFTRCPVCNEGLLPAKKEKTKGLVPERVYKYQNDFTNCPNCGKIYWQGSHWGNIKGVVEILGL